MAIKHSRVSVGTTATLIDVYVTYDGNGAIAIQNLGTASVYLGDSTVTTSSYGYELKANSTISIDMRIPEQIYGIVASGTVTVNVLQQGA